VLGQMDRCSHGVPLCSGSLVLACFSKRNSSDISKNEYKAKKHPQEYQHIALTSKTVASI